MDISEEMVQEAGEDPSKLIPEKSRSRYEKELKDFIEWRKKNAVDVVLNESVMLNYVTSLSKVCKASTLWTKFCMLKKTLIANGDVDISRFGKVMKFIKTENIDYVPKKSKILSVEQCRKFILEASDDFLLCKIVLIFVMYGACRKDELVKLTIDDIEDHEKCVLVNLPETEACTARSFIIPASNHSLNPYEIYQKYSKLRPHHVETRRFFLGYRYTKCVAQPAGKHTIGAVPKKVAKFLDLEHPENYTGARSIGHCLKRRGASMVAETLENLPPGEIINTRKSSKVTQEFMEESVRVKTEVASTLHFIDSSDVCSTSDDVVSHNICATPPSFVIADVRSCKEEL